MQLVMSTYPGWRVLFYHDIAHALTRADSIEDNPSLGREPVPLLPRAISELGGRYYQTDIHPESQIGDANFLDHPHRGMTTGQTGIMISGWGVPADRVSYAIGMRCLHEPHAAFQQTPVGLLGRPGTTEDKGLLRRETSRVEQRQH